MNRTKKPNKKNSSNLLERFKVPIFIGIFAAVGIATLLVTYGAPSKSTSSQTTLVLNSSDVHLGDRFTMNIINLPRKLASKPLIVIGSCYQDDQKVGVISSEPRGVDGSAGIAYMSVGNGLSDWILNDGPATCKADLRYDDNKGQHIVASTTMDVLGFRAQMQINQPTPVNMTDKVSFTISNLPDSVPKSSLQIHFYCDIPETGRRSTVGSTTSVYTDAGTPALVSIHSPVFKWTPTGQVTTCYSLLTQFPITLFDGITASSQNWASSKFQVKLQ